MTGRRTFLIGGGCTAFIKVSNTRYLGIFSARVSSSREVLAPPKMYVRWLAVSYAVYLYRSRRPDGTWGSYQSSPWRRWSLLLYPFLDLVFWSVMAGITYDAVQIAYAGYCFGDSTSGQVGSSSLSPQLRSWSDAARTLQPWLNYYSYRQR